MGYIILVLLIISILGLSYRTYKERNGRLLAKILAGMYLLAVIIMAVSKGTDFFKPELMFAVVLGVTLVILADVSVDIVDILSAKYKKIVDLDIALKQLEKIEDKYYCILESQQTGVYVIDGNGSLEYVNSAFCKMSGYSKKELLNMNILELVANEDIDLVRRHMQERITGAKPTAYYKVTVENKYGRRFKIHVSSSRTENGHPTITGNILEVE